MPGQDPRSASEKVGPHSNKWWAKWDEEDRLRLDYAKALKAPLRLLRAKAPTNQEYN